MEPIEGNVEGGWLTRPLVPVEAHQSADVVKSAFIATTL
jgi:hypothetical protein